MNKKGFTLIELLAVILILGIIALIAIPTVNNIIKEARRGAFSSTLNNINKAIEEKCTLEQIKNQEITTSYTITDGVITPSLDIKGDLPDGTINVNSNCEVSFTLSDNNFTGNKEFTSEIVITDGATNVTRPHYTLRESVAGFYDEPEEGTDIQTEAYLQYILSITFKNDKNIPDNAVEIWDMSEAKNNSIIGYIVKDETDEDYYHAYIGSEGIIDSHPDSSFMFAAFTNLETINFDNYNTSKVTDMSYMFAFCESLKSIDLSGFNTSKVTNMEGLFAYCYDLLSINLNNFNTSSVNNMMGMFAANASLTSLDVSSFNTSNVTTMTTMFMGCVSLEKLDLSNFDASNVTNMENMFGINQNLLEIKTPKNISSTVEIVDITNYKYNGSDGNVYEPGSFPVGITNSITLTKVEV